MTFWGYNGVAGSITLSGATASGTVVATNHCITCAEGQNNQITFYAMSSNLGSITLTPLVYLGDVAGNGRTDVVYVNGGNANVYLSTGSGFTSAGTWATGLTGTIFFADVNGDGAWSS